MNWKSFLFNILLCSVVLTSSAQAGIRVKGYVNPSDPSQWTMSTHAFIGNSNTSGTVLVSGGSSIQSYKGYIGDAYNASGYVTVTGAESRWTNHQTLNVGYAGNGQLNIAYGGVVETTASRMAWMDASCSEVYVYGANSLWANQTLYSGKDGTATISITEGGTVTSEIVEIGYSSTSTSNITVSGDTSLLATNVLTLGISGKVNLSVTDGGTVETVNTFIATGQAGNVEATISGEGSILSCSGFLSVGERSTAKLTIRDGGKIAVEETFIETQKGSSGLIHFDQGTLATGILWANYDRFTGTGTIETRGMITDDILSFDSPESINQTFHIQSATQDITHNLSVDETSTLVAGYENQGEMSVSNGTALSTHNSYFGYKAGSTGNGTVSGPTTSLTNSYLTAIGHEGTGSFSINDGALVHSRIARIGHLAGSSGTASLSGTDTRWIIDETLFAGYKGEGSLYVSDNATIDARYLAISYDTGSQGSVCISNGASVILTNGCTLGGDENTQGFLSIDGKHTIWQNNGSVIIGSSGEGHMSITDGASVSDNLCIIGRYEFSTGQALVSGLDSTWAITTDLTIGNEGNASLTISDGAIVSNENSWIGISDNASGSVSVTGIDSFWINSGNLTIGKYGFGSLEINDGGTVMVGGSLTMNQRTDATSYIQMSSGGTLAWLGDNDFSIEQFIADIDGTPLLQYWNGTEWDNILSAIRDIDYTLEYMTDGDFAGYTFLTVGTIPEPASIAILLLGVVMASHRRR